MLKEGGEEVLRLLLALGRAELLILGWLRQLADGCKIKVPVTIIGNQLVCASLILMKLL